MIACAGQPAWQAVCTAPSATLPSPFAIFASTRAWSRRCTQYVHFSITPRARTVTSGFASIFSVGESVFEYWKKLNRRTLYGQLFEQYLVPTHRLYVCSFSPSSEWLVAFTGH